MAQLSTLVDNGNFIEIPEQNLSIFKLAVNNVTIKSKSVIINTRDNDVFSLDSREFVGFPDGLTLGETIKEYINNASIGGSGSSATSSDSITTVSGQISAEPIVGTNDIIFSGLSEPLTEEMVLLGSIQLIDPENAVSDLNTTNLVISGNTLKLPDNDVFVTNDRVAVSLKTGLQGYDYLVNAYKVMIENPEWNHYTSIENIVSETNVAAAKYFVSFNCSAYRNFMLQISGTDGTSIDFKIYFTGDPDAAVPVTDGTVGSTWIEKTTEVFGGNLVGSEINVHEYITNRMPDRVLIEYTTGSAANTINIWLRKY